MAKGKKTKIKGKRKSSLLFERRKNKNGATYHINTKTGKRVSGDVYRMQWHGGKRVTNKSITNTINHVEKYADKEHRTWKELQATHDRFIKIEKAQKEREVSLKEKKLSTTILYYELRAQAMEFKKSNQKFDFLILEKGKKNFKRHPESQGIEIVSNFISRVNSEVREMKKEGTIMDGKNYLPHVYQDILFKNGKLTIKLNLRDLIGQDTEGNKHRSKALDFLEYELGKKGTEKK